MDRRSFLTWMGLGWLASLLTRATAATTSLFSKKDELKRELSSNTVSPLVFYVSPSGNDNWSGKLANANRGKTDGPFATLKRARDAVREVKGQQGGTLKQPITVFLREGSYFLSEPLVFEPKDSGTAECPIAYKAYNREKPVISGGRPITGWSKKGNLWVASLPEVKANNWYFRTLRVGNEWATRARYPKYDPQQPLTGGWLFAKNSSPSSDRIVVDSDLFPNWSNWNGAEVHSFLDRGLVNAILPIEKIDSQNHTLFVSVRSRSIWSGNRFFIANVREALDSPGEWYLDKNKEELFYFPKKADFPNIEVIAPAMDRLIILQGDAKLGSFVSNIHFEGLTFTDTDYTLTDEYFYPIDSALWLIATKKCIIKNCNFNSLGGYAIRLEQKSHKNAIISNTMARLGQGAIVIWLPHEEQPFENIIAGNHIYDCGLIYKGTYGIYLNTGSANRIAHNYLHQVPRIGIFVNEWSGRNNIVEYNKVVDTGLETHDSGAIYTIGNKNELSGTIIRYNFVRNSGGLVTTSDGKFLYPFVSFGGSLYTWGIYLDDWSGGTTVHGNIVINTLYGGICIHGGKDNIVDNNIFIDGWESQIRLQPIDKLMVNNTFIRNIVIFSNPNADLFSTVKQTWQRESLAQSDFNVYWHAGRLDLTDTKLSITPEGNWDKWRAIGFDPNSLIADPLFINPDKEDFRLQPHSPALKLGFQQIPIDRIGLYGWSIETLDSLQTDNLRNIKSA